VKFEGEFRYLKKASALSTTSAILLFFIVSDLQIDKRFRNAVGVMGRKLETKPPLYGNKLNVAAVD
jgi:hypothetical protein